LSVEEEEEEDDDDDDDDDSIMIGTYLFDSPPCKF
jgi:hypothetical protein